jgi:hypothetical protein
MLVCDFDDWSYDHDCREKLEELKRINPSFKVTLFTVPGKTTIEMLLWASSRDWVELAIHGWEHESNYECGKWSEDECKIIIDIALMHRFVKLFKAPGWQISDGCYQACLKNDIIVADQPYNQVRRPKGLKVYEVGSSSYHGHTWDCGCGNGIYEDWDNIVKKVKNETEFKFITEFFK